MKISVLPRAGEARIPKVWEHYRVFLNGRLIGHYLEADEEAGTITAFELDARGLPAQTPEGDVRMVTLKGRVRIIARPRKAEPEIDPLQPQEVALPRRERMELLFALMQEQFPGTGFALFMTPPETGKWDVLTNTNRANAIEAMGTLLPLLEAQRDAGVPEIEPDYTWASTVDDLLSRDAAEAEVQAAAAARAEAERLEAEELQEAADAAAALEAAEAADEEAALASREAAEEAGRTPPAEGPAHG